MHENAAELHEANRLSWNAATRAHDSHKGDQAAFLRAGGSTLFPEELELLGEVRGRRLLHLCCNGGQDTLSLAALGARVTGVDISDEAVATARRLARETGLEATFERADVYDWLPRAAAAVAGGTPPWDLVFSSYGALCWLSDLRAFARGVAAVLAPGGRLAWIEFHPFTAALEPGADGALQVCWPSLGGAHIQHRDGVRDYVAASGPGLVPSGYQPGVEGFENPHACHEFAWGVGDVVQAVLDAGLALETLRELPYTNGCRYFPEQVELPGRRFGPPPGCPEMPMMLALAARRAPESVLERAP